MLRRILIGIAVLSALVCVALLGTVVFFTSMKNLDGMPGHEVDVTEYKAIPQLTLRQRLGLGTASDAQHSLSAPPLRYQHFTKDGWFCCNALAMDDAENMATSPGTSYA